MERIPSQTRGGRVPQLFVSEGGGASVGYFGQTAAGHWLFGVAWYRVPLFGKSAMRHELFHAAQEHHVGITNPRPGVLRSLAIEYSAHLWGGPLIGIPLVYGGTFFILGGVLLVLSALV